MTLKRRRKNILWGVILIIILIIISSYTNRDWQRNSTRLVEELVNRGNLLSGSQNSYQLEANSIKSFQWDTIYVFEPYTSVERIYDTIGYRFGLIQETNNDNMLSIAFMNENKLVSYLYGYPEQIGIDMKFDLDNYENHVITIKKDENVMMHITLKKEI